MIDPDIPHDVREMIQRHLATMDHVELLMVLRNGREESYSVASLAEQIRKPEELVQLCLDALAATAVNTFADAFKLRSDP
ncbi:MAG: hypothetical protein ACSLFE_10210 [Gemmatimonadaceae bacterium]